MLVELLAMFGLRTVSNQLNKLSCHIIDENGIYLDGNGDYRLAENRRKVFYTTNYNGDLVIKDYKNKSIYKNITKEKAKKEEQKAMKHSKKYFLRQKVKTYYDSKIGNERIYGDRYCEVGKDMDDLNNIYVIRHIDYKNDKNARYFGDFYMNLKYELCMPTEQTVINDKITYRNIGSHYGIYSEDNSELYNTIINLWNNNIIKANTDISYKLGNTSPKDYKQYSNEISRW